MLWNDGHMLKSVIWLMGWFWVANENVAAGRMPGIHAKFVAGARAVGMAEGGEAFCSQVKIPCKICD
jgi:hypothetical protein